MTLVTLFSAPKPFTDPRIAMIQQNAIRSWMQLRNAEVLLMGDEAGIAEAAVEAGTGHIGAVEKNSAGTPLISSMFDLARKNSDGNLLCVINADMIVMGDFIDAAERARALKDSFVLLSQRWDLEVASPLDFSQGWEERLRMMVERNGSLHRPAGSDFFLFPRDCYGEPPAFAVGRAGWDNWMIFQARRQKLPVIDATPSLMIVHQSHDYAHLPGGRPHYDVPESDQNIRLAGGQAAIRYTILDATHCLKAGRLVRPPFSYLRFMRGVELFLRAIFFFLPPAIIEEVARPKRWKKRFLRVLGKG
jgi:hypothetical protein